jgi:hypothetical protein
MPDLRVETIQPDSLADVYPLVRSGTRVTLERWIEFGVELLSTGGGVLAVKASDNCVHGVAAYRPGRDLRYKESLDVEVFVAFDLRGDDSIRNALCGALDRIANERGCKSVNFTVPGRSADPASAARAGLERIGLKLESARFVRDPFASAASTAKRKPRGRGD